MARERGEYFLYQDVSRDVAVAAAIVAAGYHVMMSKLKPKKSRAGGRRCTYFTRNAAAKCGFRRDSKRNKKRFLPRFKKQIEDGRRGNFLVTSKYIY